MRLSYDLAKHFDSLLSVIKAANTDDAVEFEQGERCRVTSPVLTPLVKEHLIKKIEQDGIKTFFLLKCNGGPGSSNQTIGFFNYQTHKLNYFALNILDSRIIFNDGLSVKLSLNIAPVCNTLPKSEAEEAHFIAAGGQVNKGYFCNLL